MKPDPILEELWRVKDKLAAEAGCDADRFIENLRRWEKEHPHPGGVICSAEELRAHAKAEEERRLAEASGLLLKETQEGKPGPKGPKPKSVL
jgi:hypothetical protein